MHPKRTMTYHHWYLLLTVGYLNATIYGTMKNADPEIGPNRSSQTRHIPRVDRYESGFRWTRSSGSDCWTVLAPNQAVLLLPILTVGMSPRPVANSPGESMKQAISILEEAMEADMVEVRAKSHIYIMRIISCRISTWLLQWHSKEVGYS